MTKNEAARIARQCADAVIEQLERVAKGWDKGMYRSNILPADRAWHLPWRVEVQKECEYAFNLSRQFAGTQA